MDGGRLMRAVMALSGGMDSTGLLIRLLVDGYKVSCISYEYGQKHNVELERAQQNGICVHACAGIWTYDLAHDGQYQSLRIYELWLSFTHL